jgi:hypothetical protein
MLRVVEDVVEMEEAAACPLDELAREGARRMLAKALRLEVDEFAALRFGECRECATHSRHRYHQSSRRIGIVATGRTPVTYQMLSSTPWKVPIPAATWWYWW